MVGPATTLTGGHALLEDADHLDCGILNIRLGDEMVYPLADRLIGADIPIIFASSESRANVPDSYANVPLIRKPVDMMAAAAHLLPSSNSESTEGTARKQSGQNAGR